MGIVERWRRGSSEYFSRVLFTARLETEIDTQISSFKLTLSLYSLYLVAYILSRIDDNGCRIMCNVRKLPCPRNMQLRTIASREVARYPRRAVIPFRRREREKERERDPDNNDDDANGKSDRCRHNAPTLPDDLCRNDACRPRKT